MSDEMLITSSPFLIIRRDEEMSRLTVHLRGEFPSPDEISEELAKLYALSSEFSAIIIFINSPGGRVDSLVEILGILDLFDSVITVATGAVQSAGLLLWSRGDVRVIQPHTSLMAHRESYSLDMLKTDQQKDVIEHATEVYGTLHTSLLSTILTEDEIEFSKRNEVYLSPTTLLNRGVALDWSVFVERDQSQLDRADLMSIGDYNFIGTHLEDGSLGLAEVDISTIGVYTYDDVVYNHSHLQEEGSKSALTNINKNSLTNTKTANKR